MSRRRGGGAQDIYDKFMNNPTQNRVALMERTYLNRFTEIAIARFKWENLPETVDPRFLELTLFRSGLAVFYDDHDYGYLATRGSGSGGWNYYDNPTGYTVVGPMLKSKTLGLKDCVPIWSGMLRQPEAPMAVLYSMKMAEFERTIELNIKAMRHPFVLGVTDENRLSVQNFYRQVDEGQNVLVIHKDLADDLQNAVQVLNMRIPAQDILDLQVAKSKIWNECMTFLGVNNANQEKRERLVASEVSANNSQVLMARNAALDARRFACEQINEMFPKLPNGPISVDWNVDIDLIAAEQELAESSKAASDVGT